ncbi:hypothetical protein AB0F81_22250 [Actinoplanes sp. NPDC024001]|uniref:hypothetical protein n=1 Tax=Actinoplanes sp. NPDC024001 TaxID=3154598 RepID=UPI0033C181B5
MSRARDPKVVVIKARAAGRNLSALGNRAGRQAVVIGAEGARRTGGAWTVLRYGPPPSRRRRRTVLFSAIVAAGAIGAAAALAVQRRLAAEPVPALHTTTPAPDQGGVRTSP